MADGARDEEARREPEGVIEHYTQWYAEMWAGGSEPISAEQALNLAAHPDVTRGIIRAIYCVRTDYILRRPYTER